MIQATFSKVVFTKDEAGNFMYDEAAMMRFYNQQKRKVERQNEKIKSNPAKYRNYGICNPDEVAAAMLRQQKHNFRISTIVEA